jgi:outer membrane protein OmpA-like peptidoglycan-associated protein
MKHMVLVTLLGAAALVAGCATKNYVKQTIQPVDAKIDQTNSTVAKQATEIDQNTKDITANQQKINAVDETASSADRRAGDAMNRANDAMNHASDAMNKANQASQASDQNNQSINSLRNVVANLDDYKLQTSTVVAFGFDKYTLTRDAKQALDQLASQLKADKRFFVAVEGYTDRTGSASYNEVLSRRRADAVVEYLVSQDDVPIYRIHMIGLGETKPVDEGSGRAARAKNRRVEVKVFTADQMTAMKNADTSSANRVSQQPNPPDIH